MNDLFLRDASLRLRTYTPAVVGDDALCDHFDRYAARGNTASVPGIVTHPSTMREVTLYEHADANRGDSIGQMDRTGWFSRGPSVEELTDVADVGPVRSGVVTRGADPAFWSVCEDVSGLRWRPASVGRGHSLRGATRAHSLTVNGTSLMSRPVTLGQYRATCDELFPPGQMWCGREARTLVTDPASQWAFVSAFVSLVGSGFRAAPMHAQAIVGATAVRPSVKSTASERRNRDVITEATTLLATWLLAGPPAPKPGRPRKEETIARHAYGILGHNDVTTVPLAIGLAAVTV